MKCNVKINLSIIFFLLLFSTHLKANKICRNTFAFDSQRVQISNPFKYHSDSTQSLIVYLSALFEQQTIGEKELLRFLNGLKIGILENPIEMELAKTNSTSSIHYAEIENYFKNTELDNVRLLKWADNFLKEQDAIKTISDRLSTATEYASLPMLFRPIPPGSFMMGEHNKKLSLPKKRLRVTLTHHVEAMYIPVTQAHWFELMLENPSHFKVDALEYQSSIRKNGNSHLLLYDHPVENITWWSAIVFANKLSIKHGLPPAYDLSNITWKAGTRAEDGTLDIESGSIKINAPDGNYYETKGYRLPTEAELEYLLHGAKDSNKKYFFGNSARKLGDYAWYEDNSNQKTHAVAQLKPIIVNDGEFFDVYGNVNEWCWDWYNEDEIIPKTNPSGLDHGMYRLSRGDRGPNRVFRGGSYSQHANYLPAFNRDGGIPGRRFKNVGLRLWRTIQ